jgi:ribosomal protein RSM22 (predicted rRNA methylase)
VVGDFDARWTEALHAVLDAALFRIMPLTDCPHQPPCPVTASRMKCGQRTLWEDMVTRGMFTRESVERFLKKVGVPMTPASRVYKGELPAPVTPSLFKSEL